MKLLVLLTFLPITIFSQNIGGLVWDDSKYKTTERIADFDASKFSESIFKVDLKPYCPVPNNQGDIGSCVGQAVGYGAMTIMHAKKNNITDKNSITREAFSALYIFNQIKLDCKIGSRYNDAFELLKYKGDVKFKEYDINEADNCYKLPNEIDHKKAKINKIESYAKLFEIGESADIKIIQTRAILASGKPVLVGMEVTDDIYNVNKDDRFWRLSPNSVKKGGHAMVVIGYDDTKKAFELLNSWGEKWGNDGYCWISYDDYAKLCKYAYYLKLKE